MPLIKVEEVVSYVIGDEKIHEHLRKSEFQRARIGFRDYAVKFGIHDLGELSESQMFSIVAARNTAPIIDLLRIPRGKDLAGNSAYASYDLHRRKTSLGPAMNEFLESVPSTDQEWAVLSDPEDIPQAIPEDLLLRRLAPKEFLRRLTEGELLRSAWIQEDLDDLDLNPIEEPESVTQQDQNSEKEDGRPYGYLLLDSSESMGSGRDRRDEISRGLALAYLASQFDAGNPTVVYLFRHELSPAYGGDSRYAFESAVAAILGHSHEGMTNLQGALKLLSGVMQKQHARTDIVLITDGITRLTENPVPQSHLHTFLVGATPEEFDKVGNAQYQESLLKLQSWSDFKFRIEPAIMANASVPRREDVLDFAKILYGLEDEISSAASVEKIKRVQRRLQNLIAFIARYREKFGANDKEIETVWTTAQEATTKIGKADPVQISMQNAGQWSKVDRDLTLALELREMRSMLDTPELGLKWSLSGNVTKYVTLSETLGRLWKAMILWITRKIRGRGIRAKIKRALGLSKNRR